MSVTHDFSTNNNITYTTGGSVLSKTQKKGTGVCMCMTATWLRQVIKYGRKLKSKDELGSEIAYQASHSAINVGLTANRTTTGDWLAETLERYNMEKAGSEKSGAFPVEKAVSFATATNGAFYFYIAGDGGAHAMGFHKSTSGSFLTKSVTLSFFDPNFGQYSSTSLSKFKTYVKDLVTNTYSGQCDKTWNVWMVRAG